MRRILLLVTVASMLATAMALSGVAQAKPTATSADRQCMKLAIQTLPNFKPAHYTFHGGDTDPSQLNDDFTGQGTLEGNDVFCGFLGANFTDRLEAGDIFISGAGDDFVIDNFGTYYGEEGDDGVERNHSEGTFDGGDGTDFVDICSDGNGELISVEQIPC